MDRKKKLYKTIIITLVIISAFFVLTETLGARSGQRTGEGPAAGWIQNIVAAPYLPVLGMLGHGGPDQITSDMYCRWVMYEYPVLLYSMQTADLDFAAESDYEKLMALEGSDEDRRSIPEEDLDYDEDSMHLEKSLEEALLEENGAYLDGQADAQPQAEEAKTGNEKETGNEAGDKDTASGGIEFVPAADKSYSYRWEELQSYEMLIKAFYAVDSTTRAGEDLLKTDELLSKDMRMQGTPEEPQILIYHTHSQEMFADSVPGDESTGIVGVGEYLASVLRSRYGYNVIHHTESYDKESRDYAYSNSLPAIEELLRQYPSIEVVIDLHRDEMPKDRRLVVDLQGRPTAQFMFFNGLSRTAKGNIEYLENPYLAENLAFSFQMQAASNEYYPGLARRIYLKAYRYNMHVCPKTLLIELGAQNNTLEEAMNACDPLAHVLDLVLSGAEPQR